LFEVTKFFKIPIVHSTLLNDQLSINFQDGLDKYLNDKPPNDETLYDKGYQKLDNLLNFVEKKSLRQQDPVTGNTCLHQVAMLSNFFLHR